MYDTLAYVDIDALKMTRGKSWDRLGDLATKKRLTGAQIEELSTLYQQTTGDLALIRAGQADPDIVRVLSRNLAASRARLTGTRSSAGQTVSWWFRAALPAALYDLRWWTIISMLMFIAITAVHALYILLNPELFAQIGTPSELKHIAEVEFVQYYHQDTNSEFATSVWVNNSYVTALAVGTGITGIGPAYLLYTNAENLGVMAAIVIEYAGAWHLFRYLLPHGLPELTAVFIGVAAGFRTFWAMLVPGHYTRAQSVARTGRAMLTIALGLVILLFVSGVLEGFVTPSPWPDWVRLGLGALTTIGVWVYTLVVGGRAYRAGETGDIAQEQGGYIRRGN